MIYLYNNVMLLPLSGPATVRMVSNSGPPLPMPMQVPPGHMVQQIVDEHGILTHVILSPQPQAMPGTPMTAGTPMTVGYYVCIEFGFIPVPTAVCRRLHVAYAVVLMSFQPAPQHHASAACIYAL